MAIRAMNRAQMGAFLMHRVSRFSKKIRAVRGYRCRKRRFHLQNPFGDVITNKTMYPGCGGTLIKRIQRPTDGALELSVRRVTSRKRRAGAGISRERARAYTPTHIVVQMCARASVFSRYKQTEVYEWRGPGCSSPC
ncbi:hypothetical protein KOW79_005790 [Hemibagrus wyckioides]|uniref:Uncharacterized protein n=1 Tax=Hemibagrus wyckioides TaxID=337641 RepID=A0A9D3SNZ5_9TELE|nr:hypothetical protein KOW79_005790 [Hemibagrus wyckioides]